MAFCGGAFGRSLGQSHEGDQCPYKIGLREHSCPSHLMSQEVDPHQIPNISDLDLGLPNLQNYKKCISIVYKSSGLWYFCYSSSNRLRQWAKNLNRHFSREDVQMTNLLSFSRSVVSDSLRPHGLQHAKFPCPSPPPRVCSNSCPLSRWHHPTILSSVIPFSYLQSFPASGSPPMS